MFHQITTLCLSILLCGVLQAQPRPTHVYGRVTDTAGRVIAGASVSLLDRRSGAISDDSGYYRLRIPAARAVGLVYSAEGHRSIQRNVNVPASSDRKLDVRLTPDKSALKEVVVNAASDRRETGLIRLDPKDARALPSVTGGIEGLIKIFVGSNNELTSQYSVRGGNYDENLIYVNDFEIFRPYLVRSGQQEGLSFINPELTGRVDFYNGGFAAVHGDKMSSVLDIKYRKPYRTGGTAYASLLEQGAHLEGIGKKGRFSYLIGARNRTNQNLLASQETKGSYIPSSSDLQGNFIFRPGGRWEYEGLFGYTRTRFDFAPEYAKLTSSVFSPIFSANLGMDIFFDGAERDRYATNMSGISATFQARPNLQLKWLASTFSNTEEESYDIGGYYVFGERDFDRSRPTFGEIVNPLGVGGYQQYARNRLRIDQTSLAHKGKWSSGQHVLHWGLNLERSRISDRLNAWERLDSAGYTLPYRPGTLVLTSVVKSTADLQINRLSGYIQDNLAFPNRDITLQAGLRFNVNDLNGEWLVSPRLQAAWVPKGRKQYIFRAAAGAYHQPPFYRELRDYDGRLNTNQPAQRSWQAVAGMDRTFQAWQRPFRLTAELYHKQMNRVVPYDIDNVRIRYRSDLSARAYATGLELRLSGEWVKDAESWLSLGFMRTREDIAGDHYQEYFNRSGEPITGRSADQVPADSVRHDIGWLRRPTDRLFTMGLFFQDYLSTNRNIKVHLNLLTGSNMPYNIPQSVRYRNALVIEPYIRADVGFSAQLHDQEKRLSKGKPVWKPLRSLWVSLEVFNLLDRRNTISYQLIKDFSNTIFTMPNRLTPRLANLKLLARF